MGEARRRGTFEQRKEMAIASGRVKLRDEEKEAEKQTVRMAELLFFKEIILDNVFPYHTSPTED